MKYLQTFLLFFLIPHAFIYGQSDDQSLGSLKITKDPVVDEMLADYVKYYRKNAMIKGYRIQIFSGVKAKAVEKRKLYQKSKYFEGIPYSTLLYEAPNWKVHVGNYRNKHKAIKYAEQVRKKFRGAIVVNVKISTNKFY